MKRALVLSGGGARGAYQIGVWKALRELGIDFDIVTGTSVGALNGALVVQDAYEVAERFWQEIHYKEVFNDDFFRNLELTKRRIRVVRKYINATIFTKGLDTKSLEDNIEAHLDEKVFFESETDYGLVAFNLKEKKPAVLTKKDMIEGGVKDFIVASATVYPIFKKKQIGDKHYIDGGYYDNLPINLAIDMGATDIVAVYIGVLGTCKPVKNKDVNITYIKPKSRLGSPFYFNSSFSKRGLRLGYNDTMKVYGVYDGEYFTFEKGDIEKCYNKYKAKIEKTINSIFKNRPSVLIPRKLKRKAMEKGIRVNDFLRAVEFVGMLFKLDETKVYKIEDFNELLIENFKKLDKKIKENRVSRIKTRIFRNRRHVARKIYSKLDFIDLKQNKRKISRLSFIYPKTLMGAVYLYFILDDLNNKC